MNEPTKRTARPSPSVIIAIWLGLTAFCFIVHVALWPHSRFVLGLEPVGWLLKPIGNLVHVLTTPGWLLARVLLDSWGESDLVGSAFACAVGSAGMLLVGLWLLAARRYLGNSARPSISQPKVNESPAVPEGACTRRSLLMDGVLLGGTAAASASVVDAACFAPGRLQLQKYTVTIADLPGAFDGLRLVQLSDTHLGPRIPRDFINRAIDLALRQNPDVFLLTGDYVHSGFEWIEPAAAMFRRITATGKPTIAVLGNHDWFNDGRAMAAALRAAGAIVIDNNRVFLGRSSTMSEASVIPAPKPDCLCIAGFGDLREDHVDPDAALAGVPASVPRLVLAHNPDSAEQHSVTKSGAHRIDLMICGHTHGGQVRIPRLGTGAGLMSNYGDKYSHGLVQGPACRVLISSGIGISLVPIRFLVPPELVEITLRRAPPPVPNVK